MRDLKIKSLLKIENKKHKIILIIILFIILLLTNRKVYGSTITYNGDRNNRNNWWSDN